MTVGFDRTADCQGNHPSLTEFLRILTEHYWLCFDRTTSLTEHLGNLGFDRTVNGEMFCQKNVISRVSCHIVLIPYKPTQAKLFMLEVGGSGSSEAILLEMVKCGKTCN